jgi:hypothetical protein
VAASGELPADVEPGSWITAADAEQLEQRRLELEQQRFELSQRLTAQDRLLRDLRAQRATVDRQRAALLSARSIEHVQRELVAVQQKLQQSLQSEAALGVTPLTAENSPRASDILAKLTDGQLVRLELVEHGRRVKVWRSDGAVLGLSELSPAERDQVYLSFSLALVAVVARPGVSYPLLLDEPFLRLDAQGIAALAAVLDDLGRRGQQIVVFTGQHKAAERLASLGAPVHDLGDLRVRERDNAIVASTAVTAAEATALQPVAMTKSKSDRRLKEAGKRAKLRRVEKSGDAKTTPDKSDAA